MKKIIIILLSVSVLSCNIIPQNTPVNDSTGPYPVDITINYSYTGSSPVNETHFINFNVDRFTNGYPIHAERVYEPQGTIHITGMTSDVSEVYIDGFLDADASGWTSPGDPYLHYHENQIKIPVSLTNGPVTITITAGDQWLRD